MAVRVLTKFGRYIQARSSAIENIERTMTELGGIFTQLAQMVSEQGEQIQRIDADTDAVVEVGSAILQLTRHIANACAERRRRSERIAQVLEPHVRQPLARRQNVRRAHDILPALGADSRIILPPTSSKSLNEPSSLYMSSSSHPVSVL